jgi:flagellar hook-length control protein FliK
MPEAVGFKDGRMPLRKLDSLRPNRQQRDPFCRVLKDERNKPRVLDESMAVDKQPQAKPASESTKPVDATPKPDEVAADSEQASQPDAVVAPGPVAADAGQSSPAQLEAEQLARQILTGTSVQLDASAVTVEDSVTSEVIATEDVLDVADFEGDKSIQEVLDVVASPQQASLQATVNPMKQSQIAQAASPVTATDFPVQATQPDAGDISPIVQLPRAVQPKESPQGAVLPQEIGQAVASKPIVEADESTGAKLPQVDSMNDEVPELAASSPADETVDSKLSTLDADLKTIESRVAVESPRPTKTESSPTAQPMIAQNAQERFEQQNVDRMVQSVRAMTQQRGGEMQLKLDPPELGVLQVSVKMADGQLSATFTAETQQAAQSLSHSLQQLKNSLENAGISVDRIQVKQSSDSNSSGNSSSQNDSSSQNRGFDQQQQQSHQDRREAVRQMWRRIALGQVPVDVVA